MTAEPRSWWSVPTVDFRSFCQKGSVAMRITAETLPLADRPVGAELWFCLPFRQNPAAVRDGSKHIALLDDRIMQA